jgi:hypothetical protein
MNQFFGIVGAIVLWGVACIITGGLLGFAWAMGSIGFDFVVGLIR